jgi:hypothetical protein
MRITKENVNTQGENPSQQFTKAKKLINTVNLTWRSL